MNFSRKTPLFACLFALGFSSSAYGQTPKKPNILLLVDTSGSMEYKTGSGNYPACYPAQSNPANHEKSRWINVLEVLTGTISDYACGAEERDSSNFLDEFAMPDGDEPPDAYYRNPYHRPLSSGCAITPANPAASLGNAFDWDPPTQASYPVTPSSLTACSTAFNQAADGFIDAYGDLARFGLMTFDPLPHGGTGHSGSSPYTPNYTEGALGAFSYYVSGAGGEIRPAAGRPADCAEDQVLEVGVRNGAAPASEGKMIYFGNQDLSSSKDNSRHSRIEQILLATRPYGATPLNGALDDARAFFWYDDDNEPTTETGLSLYGDPFDGTMLSPRYDQYVSCGCRDQHIILLTDGEPNLDLRPECDAAATDPSYPGNCPYDDTAAEILNELSSAGTTPLSCSPINPDNRYRILTHIVGFSTATYNVGAGAQDCTELPDDYPDWADETTGVCATTTNEDLKVCCTLHELAEAGGTDTPYIAPDAASLSDALGDIMKRIVPTTQSRTRPVRSPGKGVADDSGIVASRILTSYTPNASSDSNVWKGNIERLRWTCDATSGAAVEQEKEVSAGDDFGFNVARNNDSRTFITFEPGAGNARKSLRPLFSDTDEGVGTLSGDERTGTTSAFPSALVDPTVLEIDYASDAACTGTSSNAQCAERILTWLVGGTDDLGNSRCLTPGDDECSVLGDIMHSTPVIVNRPSEPVEDETYDLFATNNRTRMMTAYTSTNDGLLHAFALSPNDPAVDPIINDTTNNETFAFLPPAVLPLLKSQYPNTRYQLLDGQAVTLDVVATTDTSTYGYKLERAASSANTWRTIFVQAIGGNQPGYFALDITDPEDPFFLWQLITTSAGNNLFGVDGTPLITTVDLDGVETAVAVLPGGTGDSPIGGTCARHNPAIGSTNANTHFDATITAGFPIRPNVSCYADTPALRASRSLTIVRLDSGAIIRRFAYEGSLTQTPDSDLTTSVFAAATENPLLDSPISGAPAAFPVGAGMISDRVFIGDQDGTLWRVDVSDPDPEDWTMQLFFDAYSGQAATDGKPIVVAPALSIDEAGQITVAFGTGDQDITGSSTDKQYFFSLTEVEGGSELFAAGINWYQAWTDGSHLLGPINLLGGNLYFSTVLPIANVCNEPGSTIWGMHYINPFDPSDLSTGGAAGLQVQGGSKVQSAAAQELVNGGAGTSEEVLVFGLSLEYVPSCSGTPETAEDYLGLTHTKLPDQTSSNLQLVFQTATGNTSKADLGFTTGFEAVTLQPLPTASTILAWAPLLD